MKGSNASVVDYTVTLSGKNMNKTTIAKVSNQSLQIEYNMQDAYLIIYVLQVWSSHLFMHNVKVQGLV
jgi:hypothetical protein